jgi:hypothetical protein
METYLRLVAVCRLDVVEDIEVNVVEDDSVRVSRRCSIVKDVTEDDSSLSRRDLRTISSVSISLRRPHKLTLIVALMLWKL